MTKIKIILLFIQFFKSFSKYIFDSKKKILTKTMANTWAGHLAKKANFKLNSFFFFFLID